MNCNHPILLMMKIKTKTPVQMAEVNDTTKIAITVKNHSCINHLTPYNAVRT